MQNKIQTPTWVAASALALALAVGGVTGSIVSSSQQSMFTVAADTRTQMVFEQGFSPVVNRAAPAVVNVSSSRVVRAPELGPEAPFLNDPFFRRFFGEEFLRQFRVPRERRERSLGSGVIVNPAGYVLTNNHVIEGATDITVALSDNRELKAQVVGTDPGTDIAVLRINANNLASIAFADSSNVHVGDLALAIGNPFGVGQTVTMGIVGATSRGGLGIEDYEDFIQTDAAINPGNSGGALVNVQGELIGINTAILAPSGGNLGIGFAVPSNMARQVMDQTVKHGKVIRGYMGVSIQDVTPDLAAALKLGQTRGALVGGVKPDGPAARAGLRTGDVIVEVNGKAIEDSRELRLMVSAMAPGSEVRMRVLRDGETRNVSLTLAELPVKEPAAAPRETPAPSERGPTHLGIAVGDLTPEIAGQLNLPANTKGIVIADIERGSPAAEAGLQPGDVIQEVNRKPVRNVSEFRTQLASAGKDLLLLVNREGHTLFVVVQSETVH